MSKGEKKPLFTTARLSSLHYADQPLKQGVKVQSLNIDEFESKFKCQYSESIWDTPEEAKAFKKRFNLKKASVKEQELWAAMQNPCQNLVICDMSSMNPKLGYGLYSSKPIKMNTIVAIYAGEVTQAQAYQEDGDAYAYQFSRENQSRQQQLAVSSKSIGGIARFFQHLPIGIIENNETMFKIMRNKIPKQAASDDKIRNEINKLSKLHENVSMLSDVTFKSPEVRKNLAVSNLEIQQLKFFSLNLTVFVANSDIPAYAPVGFTYTRQYWISSKTLPCFFTKDGQATINPALYSWNKDSIMHKVILSQEDVSLAEIKAVGKPKSYSNHTNPAHDFYKKAITLYKKEEYPAALTECKKAHQAFLVAQGSSSQEVITCQSTLISIYRELDRIDEAIDTWESALSQLNESKLSAKEKTKIVDKVNTCLISPACKITALQMYNRGLKQYKLTHYEAAIAELAIALNMFEEQQEKTGTKTTNQQAKCLSALISVCRDAGNQGLLAEFRKQAEPLFKANFQSTNPMRIKFNEKLANIDAQHTSSPTLQQQEKEELRLK